MLDTYFTFLKNFIPADDRPIVIHSALWPFAAALDLDLDELTNKTVSFLKQNLGSEQTLFMPTFTTVGFRNGVFDADNTPGYCGSLTEAFRKSSGVSRTKSAFFSFAAYGKDAEEVCALEPENAWGEGSVYEWFQKKNAWMIVLGLHPTFISFIHRSEWLMKDIIPYRYLKTFTGEIIQNGVKSKLAETLFVRSRVSGAESSWASLLPVYIDRGMDIQYFMDIPVTRAEASILLKPAVESLKHNSMSLLRGN